MKRFFTRNYWLFRREQFIRWLAREYLEMENQRFLRYREGILREDKVRDAELARFAKMVGDYSSALSVIARMRDHHPACEIAYQVLNPGKPYRPTGILIDEFRRRNPPSPVSAPKPAASPCGDIPTAGG